MKAIVISKTNCGYCTRVKNLLNLKDVEYTELKYTQDISLEEIEEKVRTHIGESRLTFPQVFIDDEYIGGYTETCQFFNIKA